MIILIFKAIFLFLAVFFVTVNIGRIIAHNNIPVPNSMYQAIGITGFIVLQWLI